MHERRKITRWGINKPVKIKLAGAEAFIDAQLQDINFKGIQLAFRPKFTKDSILRLKVFLTDDFILDIEVWVAWHRSIDGHNIYGMFFTKIADSDKERIYKFVFKHAPHEIHKKWWKDAGKKEEGGSDMEDRRVFQRFNVNFPVKLLDGDSSQEIEASTNDVSAKGVGICTDRQLVFGAPVEVWLSIPDHGEPLYTRGTVAWSKLESANRYRAGIALEKADLMGLSRVLRTA